MAIFTTRLQISTFLVVTIIEPEPWEGSGEPPEDWSPGEPEIITTEQTPNPHIIQALRVHQCILPIAVLALMWMLFKSRAKALKVGAEIDAALEKEKAEMDARMAAIQQKFMKMQKDQLAKQKTSEEKKDEQRCIFLFSLNKFCHVPLSILQLNDSITSSQYCL